MQFCGRWKTIARSYTYVGLHEQLQWVFATQTQCLKITEKVAFNIASEASYVYILSGQKLIKNAKNGQF